MIKKYLHSLFYPFDKTFEIVVTGEDKNVCSQFVKMCESHITSNELLQYGLEYTYNARSNIFEIKIDKQNFVKFRFFYRELPENDWQKATIIGDIFVPIFIYKPLKYSSLHQNIYDFLDKVQKNKKTAIMALVNFDYICRNPIVNTEKIFKTLQQNKEILNGIDGNEQQTLKLVFEVFQQYLNKYTTHNICNFFCYNVVNGFSFGKEEFFINLLMRLLSFDKLNNYKYQIKQ